MVYNEIGIQWAVKRGATQYKEEHIPMPKLNVEQEKPKKTWDET